MIPVQQLGWIAGVIDTQGSIVVKNNKMRSTPQLVLVVRTRNSQAINRLSSYTGTLPSLTLPKSTKDWLRRGCLEHCPEKHVHMGNKFERIMPAVSTWTITGAGAAVVLNNILPYLADSKNYPEVIAEIYQNTPLDLNRQGAHAVIRQINRLHQLGWEIPEQFEKALNVLIEE